MDDSPLSRVELLFGPKGLEKLMATRAIIFGLGGVGSWAAMCLARTGIGTLTLVDDDIIVPSNINRQLPATPSTVGQPKATTLAQQLEALMPQCHITAVEQRYTAEKSAAFDLDTYDYVIDAIDSVADKAHLILATTSLALTRLYSSMGAALRTDPSRIVTGAFYDIVGDGLARALRQRFKRLGLRPGPFTCVYSTETPMTPLVAGQKGSLCHITSIFGMRLAALVINDIMGRR